MKAVQSLFREHLISLTVALIDLDRGMDPAERTAALKVLQNDARAQIEKAGIALLNPTKVNSAGSPHLSMILSMIKSSLRPPLVSELKLFQKACLSRKSNLTCGGSFLLAALLLAVPTVSLLSVWFHDGSHRSLLLFDEQRPPSIQLLRLTFQLITAMLPSDNDDAGRQPAGEK